MTKLEKLQKELTELIETKDKKHTVLSEKLYEVISKKVLNEKEIFYLLSKIEWQGKEALGVIRINELMQQALATKDEKLKLTSTEMNALLYLLLRIKSNSRNDAKLYSEFIFPLVHNLETLVTKAKQEYDKELKETISKINTLEEQIRNLEGEKASKDLPSKPNSAKPKSDKTAKEK